jgi:hypothetical protein
LVALVEKFFQVWRSAGRRKLVMPIDNAPAHNLSTIQNFFAHKTLRRLSHPRYLPEISPSNFYLCEKVKSALTGREIPDELDLPEAVTEILNGISDAELQRNFRSWIEGLTKVIDAGGDYLTS